MSLKKNFGLRLKELRNKKRLTQSQLAEIVGIDPKHISHIETGRSFPKADLIEAFAKSFGVAYTELFLSTHFKERKFLLKEITDVLKTSSDEELKAIHRIVFDVVL